MQKKPITNKLLWIFAVGQFGWSLLSGIVANWMVYYYTGTPDAQNPNTGIFASGITQNPILFKLTLFGLVLAVGRIFDAVTDPLIAGWSDRSNYKGGRRIPFMRAIAVPFALVTIGKNIIHDMEGTEAVWIPVDELPSLAFDHDKIIDVALDYLRTFASMDPSILYDLLPRKFTVTQLRNLYEVVFGNKLDPANFYKKMTQMPYLAALDEYEQGVSHRAARFYRFDKNKYNKSRL